MITLHKNTDSKQLQRLIRHRQVNFGGNIPAKIYGTLQCKSGKRLLQQNRIFFTTEAEAINNNYRPCGHCMKAAYQTWKNGLV